MNNNQDQFKYAPNKKASIGSWSSLIKRANELLTKNISQLPLESLFEDLKIIRGGIQKISDIMNVEVTANEKKVNELAQDLELLQAAKRKLLMHLRQREIERNSHKEALQSRDDPFLGSEDQEDVEFEDDETPEQNKSPQPQDIPEHIPVKCELKFGKDLNPKISKDLVKKGSKYYRKMDNGTEVELKSEVEIQDFGEGQERIKKKIITLSMPRSSKQEQEPEGIRKSHSESIPVNLNIDPDLYRRPESEKDHYSGKDVNICSDQGSQDQNQGSQVNLAPSIEMSKESTQRFKKGETSQNYEEVRDEEWSQGPSGQNLMNFGKMNDSNVEMSELNTDQDIKMPFGDSGPPQTLEQTGSFEQSQPPKFQQKRSVKEIIMNHQKFEEQMEKQNQYNNQKTNESNMLPGSHGASGKQFSSHHPSKGKIEIYSNHNTVEGNQTQDFEESGGPDPNDTSKKFYSSQTDGVYSNQESWSKIQQNAKTKNDFYKNGNSQNKKNSLNQLIRNETGQSHRDRMNELTVNPISKNLKINLESMQTVNSGWIPGKDDSGYEQGSKGKTQLSQDNSGEIKSLGEIVHTNVTQPVELENDYFGRKPGDIERISHPDQPLISRNRRNRPRTPREEIVEPQNENTHPQYHQNTNLQEPYHQKNTQNNYVNQPSHNQENTQNESYENHESVHANNYQNQKSNNYQNQTISQNKNYKNQESRSKPNPQIQVQPQIKQPDNNISKCFTSYNQRPIPEEQNRNRWTRNERKAPEYESYPERDQEDFRFRKVKEKRLSHKSKMIVLTAESRKNRSGRNYRGVSLEDYNKKASSMTIKTSRFSRPGISIKLFF